MMNDRREGPVALLERRRDEVTEDTEVFCGEVAVESVLADSRSVSTGSTTASAHGIHL